MSKGKKIKVRFKVVDGKIHVKNLQVTPEEYKRVSEILNNVVDRDVLHGNFNASVVINL